MPGIRKQKIAIGYLGSLKKPSARMDMGDPVKARIDTLNWLKGEGPVPEHFSLLLPEDEDALSNYRKDLWSHPDRAKADAPGAYQFIAEAGDGLNRLLKSEQTRLEATIDRSQRHTREQAQKAGSKSASARQQDAEKWRAYARQLLVRGGDETLLQMATRIQEDLLETGWVRKAEWKNLSKTERLDPDTGYVPSPDVIVRFLRDLSKRQLQ